MINVSSAFKEAIKTNGKMIDAKVGVNNIYFLKEDIVSVDYSYKADFFKSVMRTCDIELLGNHNLEKETLNVQFGVKQNPDDEYEHISFGNFIVQTQEYILDSKSTKLECFDLMVKSMIPYDLEVEYPISIKNYLVSICNRLDWQLGSDSFLNDSQMILEEKYDNEYTFRDVLDEISQVTLSTIGFKNDNKLYCIYPIETNETLDFNLRKFSVNDKYGPVERLVLGRSPQEDNIYRGEEEGGIELRIDNNQIMNKDRDEFIQQMFDFIYGFEFNPFEFESFGVCYLELGDRFTIIDPLTYISYSVILMQNNIQITQGLNELASSSTPGAATTDYNIADTTDRRINKTNLQVDKQKQEIIGLVSSVDDNTEDITQVKQTIEGFDFENKRIGGTNLIKNSAGWNGLEFWESNNVQTLQNIELANNTISANGFNVLNGFLRQTFELPTNYLSDYMLSFKIKNGIGKTSVFFLSGEDAIIEDEFDNNLIKNNDGSEGDSDWETNEAEIDSVDITDSITSKALQFNSSAQDSSIRQVIDIEVGKTYSLSFKAKNVRGDNARISLEHNGTTTVLFQSESADTNWTNIAYSFEAITDSCELILENTNIENLQQSEEIRENIYEYSFEEPWEELDFEVEIPHIDNSSLELKIPNDCDYESFYIVSNGVEEEFSTDNWAVLSMEEYYILTISNIDHYTNEDVENLFKGYIIGPSRGSHIFSIDLKYTEEENVFIDGQLLVGDLLLVEENTSTVSGLIFSESNMIPKDEYQHVTIKVTTNNSFNAIHIEHQSIEVSTGSLISDIMLISGNTEKEWEPYVNEIYSSNVLIDETGIKVRNSISDIETRITNQEFAVYHESKKALSVNKDLTTLQKTEVKDDLTIGRTVIFNRDDGIDIVVLEED